MAATSDLIASNIRRIRMARKMTQGGLAEEAGISKGACQKIEKGLTAPRVDTLTQIAKALGVEIWDLVREPIELKSVRFRSGKKMRTREEILTRVSKKLADYSYLEDVLKVRLPYAFAGTQQTQKEDQAVSDQRVRETARMAREALKLSEHECIVDICGLLESAGIKVLPLSIASEGFFGLSVSDGKLGPAIIVNTWDRLPVERWIFTAAHELAHLLLHHDSYGVAQSQEIDQEEREANQFASYFLMPQSAFIERLKYVKGMELMDAVFHLKRIFMVSWKTVAWRLREMGLARDTVFRDINVSHKMRYGKGLPFKYEPQGLDPDCFYARTDEMVGHTEPRELDEYDFGPCRLTSLVWQAVERNLINTSRAAEILDIREEAADEWIKSRRVWNVERGSSTSEKQSTRDRSECDRGVSEGQCAQRSSEFRRSKGEVIHM